jgi:hypothetical protein
MIRKQEIGSMRRVSKRSVRPALEVLEGRQLLSTTARMLVPRGAKGGFIVQVFSGHNNGLGAGRQSL